MLLGNHDVVNWLAEVQPPWNRVQSAVRPQNYSCSQNFQPDAESTSCQRRRNTSLTTRARPTLSFWRISTANSSHRRSGRYSQLYGYRSFLPRPSCRPIASTPNAFAREPCPLLAMLLMMGSGQSRSSPPPRGRRVVPGSAPRGSDRDSLKRGLRRDTPWSHLSLRRPASDSDAPDCH